MSIRLIVVGKLKEKYLRQGVSEYQKRLQGYTKLKIEEVKDQPTKENSSEKEDEQLRIKEGEAILSKIKERDYVYLLDIEGKMLDSVQFAKHIEQRRIQGQSQLVFVIGGSIGVSHAVKKRANTTLSFGKMTYPHQLMRLILTEQIYRAYRIINKQPYHK